MYNTPVVSLDLKRDNVLLYFQVNNKMSKEENNKTSEDAAPFPLLSFYEERSSF